MRLFIAVELSPETKKEIIASIQPLIDAFPQVSWTKIDNLHLTLKFLGEVGEDNIKVSCQKIRPFSLSFTKLGYFTGEQLIIWLGVAEDDKLFFLIRQVEESIKQLGFPREKRVYTPHITLGRGKQLPFNLALQIESAIDKISLKIEPFLVTKLTLMQSTLTRHGPIYTPVAQFSLL